MVSLASGGQSRCDGARGPSMADVRPYRVRWVDADHAGGTPDRPGARGPSIPSILGAKMRQALRAVQLELHYSKDEILAMYLSRAPMGGIVQGAEMAARLWLGKSARDLSAGESASLTALPQSPSLLRPDRNPELARAARDKVLDRMAALGRWTATQVADAKMEPVMAPPLRAHWLAPLAAQRLVRETGTSRAAPCDARSNT